MQRSQHDLFIALFAIFCISVACVSVPGTDRKALIAIPRDTEKSMGAEAYKEVLAKEKVSGNARANAILQRVGSRLAGVAPVKDFEWEFKLIESKEMNAFCLPGGKVAVYTGILPVMENEGGLAIVLGHEIAHAVARHGAQRMTEGLLIQGGLAAIDIGVLKDSKYRNLTLGLLGAGATFGIAMPFSRGDENEADTLGLRYAAQAGYDPVEAVRFWRRFSAAKGAGGQVPELLSTHPADEHRIENMQRLQGESAALYADSPKYGTGEKL